MPRRAARWLLRRARMRGRTSRRPARGGLFSCATPQSFHQIDDLGRLAFLNALDRLALLLALDQFLQRRLVAVVEVLRLEVPRLAVDDVGRKIEHVLRHAL